jgi:hypothetical protein
MPAAVLLQNAKGNRMTKLKTLGAIFAVSALVGLGSGCGSDLVKKMDELADEACACKDKACAEKVNQKIEDALKGAKEPSKADTEKIMKAMAKTGECLAKHM